MRDRIAELLGQGLSATIVAQAVGCDDSYISQLLSEPDFEREVIEKRAVRFQEHAEHDNRINQAEKEALDKVMSLLAFSTKPGEAARVFSILNAAKRRTPEVTNPTAAGATTIELNLPETARVSFTVTSEKQVIEIEGRSMTTMPAKSLAARLEQRQAQRLLVTDVPQTLPVSALAAKL